MTMDETQLREMAARSKAFLDGVSALGHQHELTRRLVLSLLGLFARSLIDADVADGDDRQEATLRAVSTFLAGMGAQVQVVTPEQERADLASAGETRQ